MMKVIYYKDFVIVKQEYPIIVYQQIVMKLSNFNLKSYDL